MANPRARPKMLLCVDDDAVLLRMLDMSLSAYGYAVVTTTNAINACQLAQSLSIDAIVLDYAMPEMHGGEMARQIRSFKSAVPIVFFTGSRSQIPPDAIASVDAVVDKREGPLGLMGVLDRLITEKHTPVRRFPRYNVELPFVLKVSRGGRVTTLQGVSIDLAEGGFGGLLKADLRPGDRVELEIGEPLVESPISPEAEVRYRQGDSYGFQFLHLDEMQTAILRSSCKRLARA